MGEVAFRLVEESLPVDQKALTYADIIKALPPIKTVGEYIRIGDLWKEGRALLKEIDDGYNDLISAAHKLHKDAVAKKAKYYNPVDGAVRVAKSLMSSWDAEQERLRLAEQRRLEENARKEEEERRRVELERLEAERKAEEERLMEAAAAAEAAGNKQQAEEMAAAAIKATEVAQQEAATIQAEPVYVPPVVIPKTVPKMTGGPVFQKRWDFEITNEALIPRQYLAVDMVKIRQIVTALKDQTNIPGIKAFEKRV